MMKYRIILAFNFLGHVQYSPLHDQVRSPLPKYTAVGPSPNGPTLCLFKNHMYSFKFGSGEVFIFYFFFEEGSGEVLYIRKMQIGHKICIFFSF